MGKTPVFPIHKRIITFTFINCNSFLKIFEKIEKNLFFVKQKVVFRGKISVFVRKSRKISFFCEFLCDEMYFSCSRGRKTFFCHCESFEKARGNLLFIRARREKGFCSFLFCEKEKERKRKNYGVCLPTRLKRASVDTTCQPVHVNPGEDLQHQDIAEGPAPPG